MHLIIEDILIFIWGEKIFWFYYWNWSENALFMRECKLIHIYTYQVMGHKFVKKVMGHKKNVN